MQMSFLMVWLVRKWLNAYLSSRVCMGDISNKRLVLVGSTCRGTFAEKGFNTAPARCSHHTWSIRVHERKASRCLRRCATCERSWLKRFSQLGSVETTWAWNHVHETSLLEPHSVREVRVPWRWCACPPKLRWSFRARRILSRSWCRMARLFQLRRLRLFTKCRHFRKARSVCRHCWQFRWWAWKIISLLNSVLTS